MNLLRFLLIPFSWTMLGLIIGSIAYSAFAVLSVAMIMPVINLIFDPAIFLRIIQPFATVPSISSGWLLVMVGLAWIFFALKNIFYYLSVRLRLRLEKRWMIEEGEKLFKKMLSEPLENYFLIRHATRIQQATAELRRYVHLRSGAVSMMSRSLPLLIGHGLILIWISLPLTGMMLLAIPVLTLLAQFNNRRIHEKTRQEHDSWDALIHVVHQTLSAMKLVRLYHSIEQEITVYKKKLNQYLQRNAEKEHLTDRKLVLLEMSGVSFGLLLLILAGYFTQMGNFHSGPGGLVLFVASVFSMIDPAKWLVKSLQDLRESSILKPQIFKTYKENKTPSPSVRLSRFDSGIVWQSVSFRYSRQECAVFREANLSIHKRDRLLITGESGCGKSTFVDLTTGLLQPESGTITIDGKKVSAIHPEDIAMLFGVMTQEPFLFHHTIRYNLNYPNAEYTDEQIRDALEKAGLRLWLLRQPQQLNTMIGERGATMSGGEKQRLTLARLILRNPTILILDEATSALDVNMEEELMAMIMELFHDRTIIMISHRPTLERFAHRHICIDQLRFWEKYCPTMPMRRT